VAEGHTGEVSFETGRFVPISTTNTKQMKMKHHNKKILRISPKRYPGLSLHDLKTHDINPIVNKGVSGADQRLCSTTFYQ
jgi:hypothetical protein